LSKKIETVVDRIANVGNMKPNECNGPGRSDGIPKWLKMKMMTEGKKKVGEEKAAKVDRKEDRRYGRRMGEKERNGMEGGG
jgi:hypothetical protein